MQKVLNILPKNKHKKEILIASFAPEFTKEPAAWFKENEKKIKKLAKTKRWWKKYVLFLSEESAAAVSEFSAKLSEMNYERAESASLPGEFSVFGGTVDVFPVNSLCAFRVEFFGNKAESITILGAPINEELRSEILKRKGNPNDFSGFAEGDYVVHLDHGVGVFRGISESGGEKYFVVEYASPKKGGFPDTLYVPVFQKRKISKYVGFSDPKIHRLGGELWVKTKAKTKEDVLKTAMELLNTYAEREMAEREPYFVNSEILSHFESGFEHIETEGQKKALLDIKKDMSDKKPMDRLVCGDVGFGKTEIALRAAVIAAVSGRQTALLCPTTILADQHFKVFSERMKNLPFKIAILSRFESKKSIDAVLKGLREGTVGIVVGTHRILSLDVEFKNLGLFIIDEEQRFGVKQKEKLKRARSEIDVLSLSATPIPRTLYLSLSSLRSWSVIHTPPPGRLSVELKIFRQSDRIARDAILKEIKRRGQVYYLYNKVSSIGLFAEKIKKLCPRANVVFAHGRMKEQKLRSIMNDFCEGKADILVATTIIENGLDLKNVNTLIVQDCSRLGLAQSYQLKGRIGRGDRQAFAYFFYNENKLKKDAKKRIEALKKAEKLGSGYQIAEADLEIRGAGNILGTKQSGALNRVGLNLYCQMLKDAVDKLNEEKHSTHK